MAKERDIMLKLLIDGKTYEYPKGTLITEIVHEFQPHYEHDIVLVTANSYLRELHHRVHRDGELTFITTADLIGHETYRRSCSMLFLAAVHQLTREKNCRTILHFSVGSGLFFTVEGVEADDAFVSAVEERMRDMAAAKLPIVKTSVSIMKAREIFRERGLAEKDQLFRTRLSSSVNLYSIGEYEDYFYGFMTNHTGYLKYFKLYPYEGGILLQMPPVDSPETLTPIMHEPMLFRTQLEGEKTAESMGIATIGALNATVIDQSTREMILTCEALQESHIARIADTIAERDGVKFVMIAGPSSSGKTTFSQRLCIQLMARGLRPHYVGVDNYFKNREDTPKLPDGQYDFESLAAVDVEGFNRDMLALLNGERVRMPTFDFTEGVRVYKGDSIKLDKEDLLVIEGIHCLNDELSTSLPRESKFKIYISALTQVNVDEHNRIPSTDGRLIRRMVRDNRTRGHSASKTLAMWASVRKGEEENIFPYQGTADVIFNSALPYELTVLKQYVQPLLFQVGPDDPGAYEAKRLLKFLDYIVGLPAEDVPANSILREFIGGGCFRL
ncbi:MAG: nucleoside kinase [Firmicutes bacterium]|nr:nucleoside kinase [Bacillota bacterium]